MKVKECLACGAQSLPYLGMASPCRYNGGSHREMVEVEQDEAIVIKRLRAVYGVIPWYDRARLDKWLHSTEGARIRALLKKEGR